MSRTVSLIGFIVVMFNFACTAPLSQSWPTPKNVQRPKGSNVIDGRFVSAEGGFVIDIPAEPFTTLDSASEKAKAKGVDVGKQFAWKFDNTLYTIMYSPPVDHDGNYLAPSMKDMLVGSKKGILRSGGKILSENPISIRDLSGYELRYTSKEGVLFIGRVLLKGEQGYQVVGGYNSEKLEQEVLAVLDSFEITSD